MAVASVTHCAAKKAIGRSSEYRELAGAVVSLAGAKIAKIAMDEDGRTYSVVKNLARIRPTTLAYPLTAVSLLPETKHAPQPAQRVMRTGFDRQPDSQNGRPKTDWNPQ